MCRSDPQIALAVTLIMASAGSWVFGSSTSSTLTVRGRCQTTAFTAGSRVEGGRSVAVVLRHAGGYPCRGTAGQHAVRRGPSREGSHRDGDRGDLGVAVPRLARPLLPAAAAAATLARALRRALRHGRGEQRLLPAARATGVRGVALPDPAAVRRDHEGQPLPQPCQAAAGAGRAGRPADGPGRRPGGEVRPGPAAVAAVPAGRPGAARRLPELLSARHPGGDGAPARLLVDQRRGGGVGPTRGRAVVGGPRPPRHHPAVADRGLGVSAAAPRPRALAALRLGLSYLLGWLDRRDLHQR